MPLVPVAKPPRRRCRNPSAKKYRKRTGKCIPMPGAHLPTIRHFPPIAFSSPNRAHDEVLPCLFFLGTSLIWRSVDCSSASADRSHPLGFCLARREGACILGGKLALSFSALSESVRTRV